MIECAVGLLICIGFLVTLIVAVGILSAIAYCIGRAIRGKKGNAQMCIETGWMTIIIVTIIGVFGTIITYTIGDACLHGKQRRADAAAKALADAQNINAMLNPKAFTTTQSFITTQPLEKLK